MRDTLWNWLRNLEVVQRVRFVENSVLVPFKNRPEIELLEVFWKLESRAAFGSISHIHVLFSSLGPYSRLAADQVATTKVMLARFHGL